MEPALYYYMPHSFEPKVISVRRKRWYKVLTINRIAADEHCCVKF